MGVKVNSSLEWSRLRNFYNKLRGWQKGGIIGFLIGLIFTIFGFVNVAIEGTVSRGFPTALLYFIVFVIPIVLLGIFIGIVSNTNKSTSPIFYSGFIGIIFGLFVVLLAVTEKLNASESGMFILFFPSLPFASSGGGYIGIFILPFMWGLTGIIFGFIIYLVRRYLLKK